MKEVKRDIILTEGSPVEIHAFSGLVTATTALIGRATLSTDTTISLEHYRKAQFLPEAPVKNGDLIVHPTIGEKYIVVASMEEVLDQQKAATICRMMACNTTINVSGITEVVSPRGDIKKSDALKYSNLDVYVQTANATLKQENPGIFLETEYLIYAPAIDIATMDKVVVHTGARDIPLKVVQANYISYPGMVIIQVCSETRK